VWSLIEEWRNVFRRGDGLDSSSLFGGVVCVKSLGQIRICQMTRKVLYLLGDGVDCTCDRCTDGVLLVLAAWSAHSNVPHQAHAHFIIGAYSIHWSMLHLFLRCVRAMCVVEEDQQAGAIILT
jgi:hypothetical protein